MCSRMAAPSGTDGQRDPSAEPAGPFEFGLELLLPPSLPSSPAMCPADEAFLAGKVLPFHDALSGRADRGGVLCSWQERIGGAGAESSKRQRRFWCISGAEPEYRRLRRLTDCDMRAKGGLLPAASEAVARRRPKWYYLCLMGSVRVPATTHMSEIRSRQRRQGAAAVQPGGDAGKGMWKLLQSLSCSGLESASNVTAPSIVAVHVKSM